MTKLGEQMKTNTSSGRMGSLSEQATGGRAYGRSGGKLGSQVGASKPQQQLVFEEQERRRIKKERMEQAAKLDKELSKAGTISQVEKFYNSIPKEVQRYVKNSPAYFKQQNQQTINELDTEITKAKQRLDKARQNEIEANRNDENDDIYERDQTYYREYIKRLNEGKRKISGGQILSKSDVKSYARARARQEERELRASQQQTIAEKKAKAEFKEKTGMSYDYFQKALSPGAKADVLTRARMKESGIDINKGIYKTDYEKAQAQLVKEGVLKMETKEFEPSGELSKDLTPQQAKNKLFSDMGLQPVSTPFGTSYTQTKKNKTPVTTTTPGFLTSFTRDITGEFGSALEPFGVNKTKVTQGGENVIDFFSDAGSELYSRGVSAWNETNTALKKIVTKPLVANLEEQGVTKNKTAEVFGTGLSKGLKLPTISIENPMENIDVSWNSIRFKPGSGSYAGTMNISKSPEDAEEKAKDFITGAVKGVWTDVEEKPLKNIALYGAGRGAGFLVEGAGFALSNIPNYGSQASTAFKASTTIGGAALTTKVSYDLLKNIQSTDDYEQKGAIFGTTAKNLGLVGWGYATGSRDFTAFQGWLYTRGRTEIPTENLIPADVLSGKNRFPLQRGGASSSQQLKLFETQSYRLPVTRLEGYSGKGSFVKGGDLGNLPFSTPNIAWHQTGFRWYGADGKLIVTQPGTSEFPGLYGSYGVSPNFLRVNTGSSSYSWLPNAKSLFQASGKPGTAVIQPTRFVLGRSAQPGQAFIPGIKTEVEAIFPVGTQANIVDKSFYYTYNGIRIPIDYFAATSGTSAGSSTTSMASVLGSNSYSLPSSSAVFTPQAGAVSSLFSSSKRSSSPLATTSSPTSTTSSSKTSSSSYRVSSLKSSFSIPKSSSKTSSSYKPSSSLTKSSSRLFSVPYSSTSSISKPKSSYYSSPISRRGTSYKAPPGLLFPKRRFTQKRRTPTRRRTPISIFRRPSLAGVGLNLRVPKAPKGETAFSIRPIVSRRTPRSRRRKKRPMFLIPPLQLNQRKKKKKKKK